MDLNARVDVNSDGKTDGRTDDGRMENRAPISLKQVRQKSCSTQLGMRNQAKLKGAVTP